MPSDFDTDLYEAVMEDQPPYANEPADDDLWILAAASAARNAALIAAERRATPTPSDDVRQKLAWYLSAQYYIDPKMYEHPNEELRQRVWNETDDILDIIQESLKGGGFSAFGAWPQVPDEVRSWTTVRGGEHGPGFTVYTNLDTTTDCHEFTTWGYHSSDPQAALAEAVRQAREVES